MRNNNIEFCNYATVVKGNGMDLSIFRNWFTKQFVLLSVAVLTIVLIATLKPSGEERNLQQSFALSSFFVGK